MASTFVLAPLAGLMANVMALAGASEVVIDHKG